MKSGKLLGTRHGHKSVWLLRPAIPALIALVFHALLGPVSVQWGVRQKRLSSTAYNFLYTMLYLCTNLEAGCTLTLVVCWILGCGEVPVSIILKSNAMHCRAMRSGSSLNAQKEPENPIIEHGSRMRTGTLPCCRCQFLCKNVEASLLNTAGSQLNPIHCRPDPLRDAPCCQSCEGQHWDSLCS